MKTIIFCIISIATQCKAAPQNIFSFCQDFDITGCVTPQKTRATFPIAKANTNKTIRDFANSIYFRGDRLAFELRNAHARWDVTFECLRGFYYFDSAPLDKHEIEYLELKEKNVYGLVMLGSLIEKKYVATKLLPYRPLENFVVTYTIHCGKDLFAKQSIQIELK